MQFGPRHPSSDNDPVTLALLSSPMHLLRVKDQFDPIWTASLSNVLRKLQGKALLARLIVEAASLRLTKVQALAAEDYPPPPVCIVGSPWSSYLWVEVSVNTGSWMTQEFKLFFRHAISCGGLSCIGHLQTVLKMPPAYAKGSEDAQGLSKPQVFQVNAKMEACPRAVLMLKFPHHCHRCLFHALHPVAVSSLS